jgi:hypothetical protein
MCLLKRGVEGKKVDTKSLVEFREALTFCFLGLTN